MHAPIIEMVGTTITSFILLGFGLYIIYMMWEKADQK